MEQAAQVVGYVAVSVGMTFLVAFGMLMIAVTVFAVRLAFDEWNIKRRIRKLNRR